MYTGSLAVATNRQSWSQDFGVEDAETGEGIDLTDADIAFQVRRAGEHSPRLLATVTPVAKGVFNASFSVKQMRKLSVGIYDVGCTIARGGETVQLIDATWPIIDGVVS